MPDYHLPPINHDITLRDLIPTPRLVRERLAANLREARLLRRVLKLACDAHRDGWLQERPAKPSIPSKPE